MKPSEIIEKDAATNGYGFNPKQLSGYVLSSRDEGWQLMHDSDTLFMFKPENNKGDVEFVMMVGDEKTAAKSCEKFFAILKRIGAKQLHIDYLNPTFTDIFKQLGSKYKPSFSKKDDELTMKVRL